MSLKIRQVFQSGSETGENPELFKYCPYCGVIIETMVKSNLTRKFCPICNYTQYRNPYPGVSVLIIDDGKVLLGKRGKSSYRPGEWCLPGGFIEFEEDFLTAAHREVFEETGLKVEINSIINVVSNFFTSRLHTLVVVLQASVLGGMLNPGDDLEDLKWFSLNEAMPPLAFEADAYIIRHYSPETIARIPVELKYRVYSGQI